MNIEQLERIKKLVSSIRAELETDATNSMWFNACLCKLEARVDRNLQQLIWDRVVEDVKNRAEQILLVKDEEAADL